MMVMMRVIVMLRLSDHDDYNDDDDDDGDDDEHDEDNDEQTNGDDDGDDDDDTNARTDDDIDGDDCAYFNRVREVQRQMPVTHLSRRRKSILCHHFLWTRPWKRITNRKPWQAASRE